MEIEIRAPSQTSLGESFDAKEVIWLIASLLRLLEYPYLSVPVVSSESFHEIPNSDKLPVLEPFEIEGRRIQPSPSSECVIGESQLTWVADNWQAVGKLLSDNPKFHSAFKAFDSVSFKARESSSMLALWGGLEQLFAPSTGELRFRVSALLASYLEPPGASRIKCYKRILKLYNERSQAAHTTKNIESGPLMETFVLMRNALMKMIVEGKTPTQNDLESLLFFSD